MTRMEAAPKAAILTEALPWIRAYRGQTVVVKVGGAPIEDPAHAALVAEDLALLGIVGLKLVVIHGGGPQVSKAMERAGLQPSFVGGLRVTDDAAMDVVREVLAGSINQDLVARLGRAGLRAVGLSGIDDGILSAVRTAGPNGEDLGRVGRIDHVAPELLSSLLDDGYTPVIASIACDPDGQPLNVNADAVAGAVASAVKAAKLVYLTNVEGLYRDLGDEGSLVSEVKAPELMQMVDGLSEGMRPKVISALEALGGGVGKVHILDGSIPHALLLEIFTDEGIGTQVLP
jgi:acetylglutamate kinase